jgi:antitoxin (DNA-binding transcriptional repressor) of toxin-antitoxin stability system
VRSIGVKELKERTTEILREVEGGQRVAVTYYGRVLAHLVPPTARALPEDVEKALSEAREIMAAVQRARPEPIDAVDVVREMRRW